jgi:hypothetical protein
MPTSVSGKTVVDFPKQLDEGPPEPQTSQREWRAWVTDKELRPLLQ